MHAHTPAAEQAIELPVEPVSAGRARRFVMTALERWRLTEVCDDAVLLTSEVVTNALLHTTSDHIRLRLARFDDVVRIEVDDGSVALPRQRSYSGASTTGRGLALVEASAHAWGAETHPPHGKTVWFEIATA